MERKINTEHVHGENGSHTEVEQGLDENYEPKDVLQFICLDDGVVWKEIEVTREV